MNIGGLDQYIGLINIVGFLILGATMVFTQWRLGGNQVAGEVITTYKEQVVQLRQELENERQGRIQDRHDLQNKLTSLDLQIAQMRGQLIEKDKKIDEMTAILQGKDPSQTQYQKDMIDLRQVAIKYIQDSQKKQEEILKLLNKKKKGGDKHGNLS